MRWFILGVGLIIQSSFAQITVQGTVTSSSDQTVLVMDASVAFIKLDVTGQDTVRSPLGSAQTDQNGRFSFQLTTDVRKAEPVVQQQFALSDNYPNPFADQTQIGVDVQKPQNFTITIYNILGQQVARLQTPMARGSQTIHWKGSTIPGVYFASIEAGGQREILKLVQLNNHGSASTLQITRGAAPILNKTTSLQTPAAASYLQITISKPGYQTYTSPVLPYTSQSLSISLNYLGTIFSAKRDSTLKQNGVQFTAYRQSLPKLAAAQAMAVWLKTQPEVEDAGAADDGNAWCRFTDGTIAIYVNNRDIGDTAVAIVRPQTQMKTSGPGPVRLSDIPATNQAFFSESLGPSWGSTAASISHMTNNTGYMNSVSTGVDMLKSVNAQNSGIVVLSGHGGYGIVPGGGTEFAIWTNTERTPERDMIYADDLREHRLVWMRADYDYDETDPANPVRTIQENYAFTQQFVRKYMTFGNNSLVYLDACASLSNNVFATAFLVKGASAVAGYTADIDSRYGFISSLAFFNCALGTNWEIDGRKENPPQRPFDWPAVLTWMQSENLDRGDGSGTAKLICIKQTGADKPAIPLAPSIASMFVHPFDEKLYIWGIFGENPGTDGTVTVMGTPLQVLEWGYDGQFEMDKIICKIPTDGAGSYGDVQVKVREIESNITQLSRYKGDFTLKHETMDGRKYEVKLTLQFRVHLLGFRMKPHAKPTFNQNTYVVNADMASTGESTASGSTGSLVTWSGHVTDLHNNIDGAQSPRGFEAGAWFDPEQMKMQLYLSGAIKNGIIQFANGTSTPLLLAFGVDTFDGKHEYFPSYVEIPLKGNFSIAKSSGPAKKVGTYYSIAAPMADQVKIEWDDITCDNPPMPETPR